MTIRLRLANNTAAFTTDTKRLKWSWFVHCLLSIFTTRGDTPEMWPLLFGAFCSERTIRAVHGLESLLELHLFSNFIQTVLRCLVILATGCTGWYLYSQNAVETAQIGAYVLNAAIYTWLVAVVIQTVLYWIGYLLTLHMSLVLTKLLRYGIGEVLIDGHDAVKVFLLRCQIDAKSAY
jgi:hypothetical protein